MKPVITCLCPTHGRAHLVEEAVESYLRQWPCGVETELLIVNDCPEQTLRCDAPGVRIINLPEPITDLSAKFNTAVELASGDWIAWWEDDDISLPFRLRNTIRDCDDHGDLSYFKQEFAFVWHDGDVRDFTGNLFFGNSTFRRDYFGLVGGAQLGHPADASAHRRMMDAGGKCCIQKCEPRDAFWIYRWGGTNGAHDSSVAGTNADRFAAFRARTLASPHFVPGEVVLNPHWKHDYTAQVARFLESRRLA